MYLSNIKIVLNAVENNPATQVIHLDGTDYVIYQKKLDALSRAKLKDSLESSMYIHGPIKVIEIYND
ncbi:hypothetical protein [Fusobacterium varium]|uniref:hypothetical protein n=1 Tax=Fusobacterium varium TaxID=856 RepID=UPI000E3F8BA9|nr:hypothetical protein [Fusobacterium varium]RGJ30414.1 hypothetical protein DXD66_04990 [Fusobacterium varium]